MQIGMIGLGRMGANMVRRLMRQGHECVVFDVNQESVKSLEHEGATGAATLDDFVEKLAQPRHIWMMVPAALVDRVIQDLSSKLHADDVIIDGGNSYYRDDIRHAESLKKQEIHYLDVGTSGGTWGLERGYCLMIGGEKKIVSRLEPIFRALAPVNDSASPAPDSKANNGTASDGYLHCGPHGAGHFVKMVHNGIEYGLMAAYAEGFNILKHANAGTLENTSDAETAPLREPEFYKYDLDLASIAEVWRHGSVVSSWLLDLSAHALLKSPQLETFSGHVSDSGEGRWTNIAAIETGVPTPVLTTALYSRFSSRGESDFADRLLSAMRFEFGGHKEKQ